MTRANQEKPMTEQEKLKIKRIKENKKKLRRLLFNMRNPEKAEELAKRERLVNMAKQINPFERKNDSGYSDIPQNFSMWSKDAKKGTNS
jgi:hypothetical protein